MVQNNHPGARRKAQGGETASLFYDEAEVYRQAPCVDGDLERIWKSGEQESSNGILTWSMI